MGVVQRRGVQCLILFLILSLALRPAEGFAAWLKCYIDINDPEEVIMNSEIVMAEDAEHKCQIEVKLKGDEQWSTGGLVYPPNKVSTVQARLQPPENLANEDIQYVMETTEPGAKFIKPIMCDGKRSHARNYQNPVTLEIDGTAESVELVAAWAKGHEPVSLTTRIKLTRGTGQADEL